ncbi:MAG: hypothetical protein J6Q68_04950 [Clostridia bacterium]|nr:hypothetical protein [Clostridia bacterium]
MVVGEIIAIAAVAFIIGGALTYIIIAKKKGKKCIGCPYADSCNKCCGCKNEEKH